MKRLHLLLSIILGVGATLSGSYTQKDAWDSFNEKLFSSIQSSDLKQLMLLVREFDALPEETINQRELKEHNYPVLFEQKFNRSIITIRAAILFDAALNAVDSMSNTAFSLRENSYQEALIQARAAYRYLIDAYKVYILIQDQEQSLIDRFEDQKSVLEHEFPEVIEEYILPVIPDCEPSFSSWLTDQNFWAKTGSAALLTGFIIYMITRVTQRDNPAAATIARTGSVLKALKDSVPSSYTAAGFHDNNYEQGGNNGFGWGDNQDHNAGSEEHVITIIPFSLSSSSSSSSVAVGQYEQQELLKRLYSLQAWINGVITRNQLCLEIFAKLRAMPEQALERGTIEMGEFIRQNFAQLNQLDAQWLAQQQTPRQRRNTSNTSKQRRSPIGVREMGLMHDNEAHEYLDEQGKIQYLASPNHRFSEGPISRRGAL